MRATFPVYVPASGIASMPPFTQAMGPWFATEAADTKYATALGRRQAICADFILKLRPYTVFMQNFHHSFVDWLPFYWEGFRQTTRYTYILGDISDAGKLWAAMSANIRRNINRARCRNKISVRRGLSAEDLSRMAAMTFGRQNLKLKHAHLLEALVAASRQRGRGDIWGGYDDEGRLHAAAFVVWHGDTAYYIAGGSDPALRESGAHSLTLWEAIRAVAAHSRSFDFEGSMLPGVERVFREFGAVQTPYFCISKGKPSVWDRIRIRLNRHG